LTREEFIGRAADAFLAWQYRGNPGGASTDDTLNAVEAVTVALDAVCSWQARQALESCSFALGKLVAATGALTDEHAKILDSASAVLSGVCWHYAAGAAEACDSRGKAAL
jgi:hypothetical protein